MAIKEIARRWGQRAYGALNVWAVLPQGVVAVIAAWASTSVHWMHQLGWFGIIMSGLIAYAVVAFGRAQTAKLRVLKVEAKARELVAGESSPFDPMAHVYENKRLYLRDLAPMGRRTVANKRFVNCEIIGPGVVMIGMQTDPSKPGLMRDSHTLDGVDVFEIDPERESKQAIKFWDCDFDGCKFYHMSMLFTGRQNEGLHWMTKDSRQALLRPSGALAGIVEQGEETDDDSEPR